MRDGVVLLFYDVSVGEKEARREYRELFKGLKRDGYMQLQKSVFISISGIFQCTVMKLRGYAKCE